MSLASIFDNLRANAFKKYSKGLGDMLLITGTLGWVLSAAGQLVGIKYNNKISKEKKEFLIPQELADAGINIASFFLVTAGIKNIGKWLVSSGKIITPAIKKVCEHNKIEITKGIDIGKALSENAASYKISLETNNKNHVLMDQAKIDYFGRKNKGLTYFYDNKYAPLESGVETLGSIIGAVISSNIITPLIRNPIAASRQKQAIAQEKYDQFNSQQISPVMPMQNKFSMADYRAKIGTSSGSMRI